jgi:undecaprenyl-phosphate 4-deoxy-4-formamido-L-arabinose transferase
MPEVNTMELPDGISVVVPVFNSERSLPELLRRLSELLPTLTKSYEVILVNDGSRDCSWEVVCRSILRYPWVTGINLMRNYGQHNALLCGIRRARYRVTVTIDDDLQNPPEEIPRLIARLDDGYDVVYGTPQKQQHGLWRNLASRITKLALQTAMGAETASKVSAFRAFRTQVRNAFTDYQSTFVSIDVLLTWGTTRFASIPVQHEPRQVGLSNYSFHKLVGHALDMMTGFSTWPLQMTTLIGFGLTVFGVGVFIYVIARYIIAGGSVPGFPFLASIISIFSGAQLFALGIIGEYLSRMHFRIMKKPAYVTRNLLVSDQDTEEIS